jgi:hypothetical protein
MSQIWKMCRTNVRRLFAEERDSDHFVDRRMQYFTRLIRTKGSRDWITKDRYTSAVSQL